MVTPSRCGRLSLPLSGQKEQNVQFLYGGEGRARGTQLEGGEPSLPVLPAQSLGPNFLFSGSRRISAREDMVCILKNWSNKDQLGVLRFCWNGDGPSHWIL